MLNTILARLYHKQLEYVNDASYVACSESIRDTI